MHHTYLAMPSDRRTDAVKTAWDCGGPRAKGRRWFRPELMPEPDARRTGFRGDRWSTGRRRRGDAAWTSPTYYDASVMNPKVLVGDLPGGHVDLRLLCHDDEGRRTRRQGHGRGSAAAVPREAGNHGRARIQPDYARPVAISTKAAQREMILPSLLGLAMPIAAGLVLGVGGVLGLLVGTLTTGFCVAIFMANAGGAWDNAKKYIEAGHHGGKGSDAHKAGVVGDTVGDPFKDTSGPSLNILIKLMSMVSVVVAGLVVRYSLVALGIF